MAKIKFICNHCGKAVMWYKTAIHEITFQEVDDKLYCDDCIKKIGHIALDSD